MNLQMKLEEESKKYIENTLNGRNIEKLVWGEGGELYLFSDETGVEKCLFTTSLNQEQLYLKESYYRIVRDSRDVHSSIIFCEKIECQNVLLEHQIVGCFLFITMEKIIPLVQLILEENFCVENNNQKKIKILLVMKQACERIIKIQEKYSFINLFINYEEICVDKDGNIKLLLFDMLKNQIEIKNHKNEIELITKQMAKGLGVDLEPLPLTNTMEEFMEICQKEAENLLSLEEQYKQKFNKYLQLAENGNVIAQKNLGYMYEKGKGIVQNYEKAVMWYETAAMKNNAQALNNLAHMYQKGYGVKKDYKTAIDYLLRAAKLGDCVAQLNLGIAYQMGKGVEKNLRKALYWYKKSMKQGNKSAKKMYEQILLLQKDKRNGRMKK